MHSNLSITDGVYGIMSENDVKMQIINISNKILREREIEENDIVLILGEILERLKK
jgi:hypothetical protein